MKHPSNRARFATGSRIVSRTARLDVDRLPSPDDLPAPRVLWKAPEGALTLGAGQAAVLTARGPHRFRRVREEAAEVFENVAGEFDGANHPGRPRFYGGFGFFDDPRDPATEDFHGAYFVLPRFQFVLDGDGLGVTVNETVTRAADRGFERALGTIRRRLRDENAPSGGTPPAVVSDENRPDREKWIERVDRLIGSLDGSDLHKLVLAQSRILTLDRPASLSYLVNRLRRPGGATYRALLESPEGALFATLTPETLVRVSGDRVLTESLAGSARTGSSPRETINEARGLMDSDKNRREHEVVLESICDRLEPYVRDLERRPRTVRTLSTVQHLATPVEATLRGETHVLELVEALHPTPAVGGVPVHRALQEIRRHEPFDRGFYGGPVGWFDARGEGDFGVGIRSALIRDRTATLYAGAGIVADSRPEDEWEELQWKYRSFLRFLADPASLRSP